MGEADLSSPVCGGARCGDERRALGCELVACDRLEIRRRERKQIKFKSQGSAQRFVSAHGPIFSTSNLQAHLISRPTLRRFRAAAHRAWAEAAQTA